MHTQHTPGPWHASNVFTGYRIVLGICPAGDGADAHFNPICTIAPIGQITPIQWANARLISAAPALLSILQEIVQLHQQAAEAHLVRMNQIDPDSDHEIHFPDWHGKAIEAIHAATTPITTPITFP